MGGSKILVLGGTGPAGICLLRELVYRKHATVVYCRSPSKIPDDLALNPLIEVCDVHPVEAVKAAAMASQVSILIFPIYLLDN
jgi:putative NADH-flavin reductase